MLRHRYNYLYVKVCHAKSNHEQPIVLKHSNPALKQARTFPFTDSAVASLANSNYVNQNEKGCTRRCLGNSDRYDVQFGSTCELFSSV